MTENNKNRFTYEDVNFCNDNLTGNQYDLTNPNEMLGLLNALHEENEQLKKKNQELENELLFNKLNDERLESINYQLSVRCHDYEKSLYNGRKYLKKLNEKFEKIFGISLENFLDIEYKR